MAGIIGGFALLALLGSLAGRLLGPLLKVCPYRLSALLAAGLPTGVGLAQIVLFGEDRGLSLALGGIFAGMGGATGVFLTGDRGVPLACLGGLVGGALGAGLLALLPS